MGEATRVRPVEYYNPRPLILGVCFFWGVVMGFGLNFFRTPISDDRVVVTQGQPAAGTTPATASPQDRRLQNLPNIASVEPAPTPAANLKPTLDTMDLEPPPAVLTTDGGLTGRTASLPGRLPPRQAPPPTARPARPATPPPIPELMP